jgi:hypothetical protein
MTENAVTKLKAFHPWLKRLGKNTFWRSLIAVDTHLYKHTFQEESNGAIEKYIPAAFIVKRRTHA